MDNKTEAGLKAFCVQLELIGLIGGGGGMYLNPTRDRSPSINHLLL